MLYNDPLPVVYIRRLVYEHCNGLCRIVEYFVVKKVLAKASLSYLIMLLDYFSYLASSRLCNQNTREGFVD